MFCWGPGRELQKTYFDANFLLIFFFFWFLDEKGVFCWHIKRIWWFFNFCVKVQWKINKTNWATLCIFWRIKWGNLCAFFFILILSFLLYNWIYCKDFFIIDIKNNLFLRFFFCVFFLEFFFCLSLAKKNGCLWEDFGFQLFFFIFPYCNYYFFNSIIIIIIEHSIIS